MKNVKIYTIKLKNFKGIKALELKLSQNTELHGANGSGKTTIFDAFTWLLFDKDSQGRSSFGIKTLDKDNKPMQKTEHEVSAILDVAGEEISVRKVLKEKWVKTRGALESAFVGNTVDYYWNDVPKSQREFQDNIKAIVDESVFKMITNPLAFSQLNWKVARGVLIDLVGGVNNVELAKGDADFEALLSKLTNKSLDEYQKQLASQRKLLNDSIKGIPTRIDEVNLSMPENLDFEALEKEKVILDRQLKKVEDQIDNRNIAQEEANKKYRVIETAIFEKRSQINNIKHDVRTEVKSASQGSQSLSEPIKHEIANAQSTSETLSRSLKNFRADLDFAIAEKGRLTKESDSLRAEWMSENASKLTIDEEEIKCPTCRRALDTDDIEAEKERLIKDFNTDKRSALANITAQGKATKALLDNHDTDILAINSKMKETSAHIDSITKSIKTLEDKLSKVKEPVLIDVDKEVEKTLFNHEAYQLALREIKGLEIQLSDRESVNIDDLKAERSKINLQVDNCTTKLRAKEEISRAKTRITELEKEEKDFAQQIADLEKEQYIAQQFTRKKVTTLENKVNKLFSFVKFKLFDIQVNGAEAESCIPLINGVPFSDANTASQVNAGIDIINAMANFYEVSAPIFIDNRESVTEIIKTKAQVISLVVSPADKILKIK